VFPNNSLAPGRPAPSASEILEIRTKAATAIVDALPAFVARGYFGPSGYGGDGDRDGEKGGGGENGGEEEGGGGGKSKSGGDKVKARRVKFVEEEILDVFADAYCNRHFVFAVVEGVVCRVFPEMGMNTSDGEGGGLRDGSGSVDGKT